MLFCSRLIVCGLEVSVVEIRDKDDGMLVLEMRLKNNDKEKCRVLAPDSPYGFQSITLAFVDELGAVLYAHRPIMESSGPVVWYLDLQPGEVYKYKLIVNGDRWYLPRYLGDGEAASVYCEFSIPKGGRVEGWKGYLRSDKVSLEGGLKEYFSSVEFQRLRQ